MRDLIPFFDNRLSLARPIFDEIDRALNDVFSKDFFPQAMTRSSYPKMNIYDDSGNLCIDAYIPETPKDKIDIVVEDGILTLRGSESQDKNIDNEKYYCREISRRAFSRSIKLPSGISMDNISAEHKDGILKVKIPYISKDKINNIKKIDIK